MPNVQKIIHSFLQWKTKLARMNNWGVQDSTGIPFGNVLVNVFKENKPLPYLYPNQFRKGTKAHGLLFSEPFSPTYCHVPKSLQTICTKLHETPSWDGGVPLFTVISRSNELPQKTLSSSFILFANLCGVSMIDRAPCWALEIQSHP